MAHIQQIKLEKNISPDDFLLWWFENAENQLRFMPVTLIAGIVSVMSGTTFHAECSISRRWTSRANGSWISAVAQELRCCGLP